MKNADYHALPAPPAQPTVLPACMDTLMLTTLVLLMFHAAPTQHAKPVHLDTHLNQENVFNATEEQTAKAAPSERALNAPPAKEDIIWLLLSMPPTPVLNVLLNAKLVLMKVLVQSVKTDIIWPQELKVSDQNVLYAAPNVPHAMEMPRTVNYVPQDTPEMEQFVFLTSMSDSRLLLLKL